MQWYRKHRPRNLGDIRGQSATITSISKALKSNSFPEACLMHGQRGVGKTTVARILRHELGCTKEDYREINAAKDRGIDTIREMEELAPFDPDGKCRIWVLDEAHQLTSDASNALLKVLEDPEPKNYYILCSTELRKFIPTIRSRCQLYEFLPVNWEDMLAILSDVASAESVSVDRKVLQAIAEASDGSPRDAINLLENIANLDHKEQLRKVERAAAVQVSQTLAQALQKRASWEEVQKIIGKLEEEPERVRQGVLAYSSAVLMGSGRNGKEQAALIIDVFGERPFYDAGKWQIIRACWEILGSNS